MWDIVFVAEQRVRYTVVPPPAEGEEQQQQQPEPDNEDGMLHKFSAANPFEGLCLSLKERFFFFLLLLLLFLLLLLLFLLL